MDMVKGMKGLPVDVAVVCHVAVLARGRMQYGIWERDLVSGHYYNHVISHMLNWGYSRDTPINKNHPIHERHGGCACVK